MYLENDLKWRSTPLLCFISLLKVHRSPHHNENNGFQPPLKFLVKNKDQNGIFIAPELLFQGVQKAGIQKAEIKNAHPPIRLEISREKINLLLQRKQICAADIRCLDANSKQCLTKLCLLNCLT